MNHGLIYTKRIIFECALFYGYYAIRWFTLPIKKTQTHKKNATTLQIHTINFYFFINMTLKSNDYKIKQTIENESKKYTMEMYQPAKKTTKQNKETITIKLKLNSIQKKWQFTILESIIRNNKLKKCKVEFILWKKMQKQRKKYIRTQRSKCDNNFLSTGYNVLIVILLLFCVL